MSGGGGAEKEEIKRNSGGDGVGVISSLHFGPEGQSLPHLCLEMAVHVLISGGAGGELRGF